MSLPPSPMSLFFTPASGSPRYFKSKSNDFLKLNCKISQLYVTLMNDFDKTFVLAFYNSLLNIKLNGDKEKKCVN